MLRKMLRVERKVEILMNRGERMGFDVHEGYAGFTIIEIASDRIIGRDLTFKDAKAWLKKEADTLWYDTDADGITRKIG